MVIVDSVAALARADFSSHAGGAGSGRQGMVDRQEALGLVRVLVREPGAGSFLCRWFGKLRTILTGRSKLNLG